MPIGHLVLGTHAAGLLVGVGQHLLNQLGQR